MTDLDRHRTTLALRLAAGDDSAAAPLLAAIDAFLNGIVEHHMNRPRMREHRDDLMAAAQAEAIKRARTFDGRARVQFTSYIYRAVAGAVAKEARVYLSSIGAKVSMDARNLDFDAPAFRGYAPLVGRDGASLMELESTPGENEVEKKRVARHRLMKTLQRLPRVEKDVIMRRYGIPRERATRNVYAKARVERTHRETLDEIGGRCLVSGPTVGAIQKRAMEKLGIEAPGPRVSRFRESKN